MILTITVGRKKDGKFIDEPFIHTISSDWLWLLSSRAGKAIAKITSEAAKVYYPHGKDLRYGKIMSDKDRPNYSEVEVMLDGRYAFSIEQDALI